MYKPYMGSFMSTMMAREFRAACTHMSAEYAAIRQWRKLNRDARQRIKR